MGATPFRTKGRVSGDEFFGRIEDIRIIIRQLRGLNNVAIVGAPRMGKSSLITTLFWNYKRADRDVRTWFTDMQEIDTLDDLVEEFYIGTESQPENHKLLTFTRTLRAFHERPNKKRLIMFIDSAERFAEPPFNEEALFAVLASHLPSQYLTLCLASTLPPGSMLTNKIGFPLHELFFHYDLPPFSASECKELIEKKLQWSDVEFTKAEIENLIAESKGHPAELQQLSSKLYKQKLHPLRET